MQNYLIFFLKKKRVAYNISSQTQNSTFLQVYLSMYTLQSNVRVKTKSRREILQVHDV